MSLEISRKRIRATSRSTGSTGQPGPRILTRAARRGRTKQLQPSLQIGEQNQVWRKIDRPIMHKRRASDKSVEKAELPFPKSVKSSLSNLYASKLLHLFLLVAVLVMIVTGVYERPGNQAITNGRDSSSSHQWPTKYNARKGNGSDKMELNSKKLQVGLDPTEARRVEEEGGVYRRLDGTVVSYMEIIQEHKYDWVRVRIMVNPDGRYGLFQDLDYVLHMAQDVKSMGLKFLLDFHYSHWWADGENQWCPISWRRTPDDSNSTNFNELVLYVYQHTYEVMNFLHQKDVLPDAVQVGNEISSGLLWGYGRLPKNWDKQKTPPTEWLNLVDLLAAGIRAVKTVSDVPKIVIHLDTGGSTSFTEKWMTTYFGLGGEADILGLSWYPMWHGTMTDLRNNINNLETKFPNLDVWVVETAYYWSGECDASDEGCRKKFPYPMTEQGQFDFLQALRKTLLATSCKAVFYWGSHWSQPDKWFIADEKWEDAERRSLFDRTGRVLKGMAGLIFDPVN